jgi:hypothetical protein
MQITAQTAAFGFVMFIWVICAIKTVIPNEAASKACLLGYKASCSFTPVSTVICLIGAVVTFVVAKKLMII